MVRPMTLFALLLALPSLAATFTLEEPCTEKVAVSWKNPAAGLSVGAFTVRELERAEVPYEGSEAGISSIYGTATGMDALEVLNDREMRSFGWCYEVDGKQPDLMPDALVLKGGEQVRWFFAFSLYRDGKWVSYCEPASRAKGGSVCP